MGSVSLKIGDHKDWRQIRRLEMSEKSDKGVQFTEARIIREEALGSTFGVPAAVPQMGSWVIEKVLPSGDQTTVYVVWVDAEL